MSERVAQHNADARKIEDEIFKINQPVALHYVLEKVPAKAKAKK
jgi:hypothetical protein